MASESQSKAAPGAAQVVRIEAEALEQLAARLEGSSAVVFDDLLERLAQAVREGHRLALCGMGKSGLIARKVAATLVSMGVPALFLHPAEALHGDLGALRAGDAVLALSYSGETEELVRLVPLLERLGVRLFAFCGCMDSSLARASEQVLDVAVDREACAHQLAPTASTTAMLALGDALAVELSRVLGFAPQTFAARHPGGQLGRRLTAVAELMHAGEAVPVVAPGASLTEMMHEMSAKRLGMTTVQALGRLLGVLSDGDLRRLMERDGPLAFHRTAAEVMKVEPRTIAPGVFAAEALAAMEALKITCFIVTSDGTTQGDVQGVVHMHDLLEAMGSAGSRP